MAQNYKQPGKVIEYTIPSATTITSGQPLVIGDLPAVALGAGTAGDVISVQLEGIFELGKVAGTINQGAKVYLTTAGQITGTESTNKPFGFAAKTSAGTTIEVKLVATV